jgi:hypothetical protein
MIDVNYREVYKRHIQKMNVIAHGIIAARLRTLGLAINNIMVGWPAIESEDAFNSVDEYPLLNIYPIGSSAVTNDTQNQRTEEITWNVVVVIKDSNGKTQTSYNLASETAREVCQLIETYLPDSPTDYVGYCVRADQLNGQTFRQEGGVGALSQFSMRAILKSTYGYAPLQGVTNMPSITQRDRWVTATIALGDGTNIIDSELAQAGFSYTLNSTGSLSPTPSLIITNPDADFSNGYVFDQDGDVISVANISNGVSCNISGYNTTAPSGYTFDVFVWQENSSKIHFSKVTVIAPIV